MKRTLMILTAAAIMVTALFGQDPRPPQPLDRPGRPGFNRMSERGDTRMKLERLDLTQEQRDKIEASALDVRKKIIPIRAEIELRQLDLRTAMDSDKPDEQKILTLSREIHDLEFKIKELRIKERLLVHSILTPQQRDKLRNQAPEPEDE